MIQADPDMPNAMAHEIPEDSECRYFVEPDSLSLSPGAEDSRKLGFVGLYTCRLVALDQDLATMRPLGIVEQYIVENLDFDGGFATPGSSKSIRTKDAMI